MLAFLRTLNHPVYAVLAVAAIAGALRFAKLSDPPTRMFDEFYYSKSACILLGESNKVCDVTSPDEKYWRKNKWDVGSWIHPPLGKWMIALGEKVFGAADPFGWRVSSAIAGTLVCVMVALIAQVLWGRPLWTFVAGLLAAVESLDFVLSRLSLLDIFVAFWTVAAFLALVMDRRWIARRTPVDDVPPPPPAPEGVPEWVEPPKRRVPSPIWRPWRFAAGAAIGAAAAVKWSGLYALPAAVLLTYGWETVRRKRDGVNTASAFAGAFAWETFGSILAFVVVPTVVYVATWVPWFHHFGWSVHPWIQNQLDAWHFSQGLKWTGIDPKTNKVTPGNPYYSHAYSWLSMTRPVSIFAQRTGDTQREILAIGNPAIFWASFGTLPYLAYAWVRGRDWRAGFILVAVVSLYVPWFFFSRPQFLFYMSPVSPFLVLAAVCVARAASDARLVLRVRETGEVVTSTRHPYRPLAVAYVIVAVAAFAWFYPVLTGIPISLNHWHWIVWFPSWV